MGKVINIRAISPPVSPQNVLIAADVLSRLGIISRNACNLAGYVIHAMYSMKTRQVSLPLRGAEKSMTVAKGEILTGPVKITPAIHAIDSLRELHSQLGILNGLNLGQIKEDDAVERHFTLSPDISYGIDWDMDTTIHFLLPNMEGKAFDSAIKRMVHDAIGPLAQHIFS